MRSGISELQSNAESRVDRVVQTLDTGYSDVFEQSAEYKIMELFMEYALMKGPLTGVSRSKYAKQKDPLTESSKLAAELSRTL